MLTGVLRQEENSGILANATKLREMLDQDEELSGFPIIDIDDYTDIRRISGGDLIEEINYCYDNYGLEETLIITRSVKKLTLQSRYKKYSFTQGGGTGSRGFPTIEEQLSLD